jgi:hypothetical protein
VDDVSAFSKAEVSTFTPTADIFYLLLSDPTMIEKVEINLQEILPLRSG